MTQIQAKKNLMKNFFIVLIIILIVGKAEIVQSKIIDQNTFSTILFVEDQDLQDLIEMAKPYSEIICDRNKQLVLSSPIIINKPITLKGLNAKLPDSLGKTSLLIVQSPGVIISDFELHGNAKTVLQNERAPLMWVTAGDFTIERGIFKSSSKEGIAIEAEGKDLVGGVVRNIKGSGIMRDLVSINGGYEGLKVENILIENVSLYDSPLRGAVEVSNGTKNITVKKVHAEDCVYAVDVQDHENIQQINRNVFIQDIFAKNCKHAVRTANIPIGHTNLTIKDVIAENCIEPIQVSNTEGVFIKNVRIIDHNPKGTPVNIKNCNGLIIRDIFITNSIYENSAVLLQDCNHTLIDGIVMVNSNKFQSIVHYQLTNGNIFSGLKISNVIAPEVEFGILLTKSDKGGTLQDYKISENITTIVNKLKSND